MYIGPRAMRLYDPADTKKAMWNTGLSGMDNASEMAKGHDHLDAQDAQAAQEESQNRMMGMYQAAHERNLQAAEQQRRAYDSETARQGENRKWNVIGNLLR